MTRKTWVAFVFCLSLSLAQVLAARAQTVTATLSGRVLDSTGAVVPKVAVTAVNTATGFSRSAATNDAGEFQLLALPVGEYTVTAEISGFKKEAKTVTLQIGQVASVEFTLTVGQVAEKVVVEAGASEEVAEPTRTQVSSVITMRQIEQLPVNGRQFIDFTLLAPAVQIGDTTTGSTDVIVEPVTKLSFAGQNIHYNFIAVDGADNISTASGIQRATPSQEAVREFRVVNTSFSTEFGRAAGGVVNIITRSGSNEWHGSLYDYFRSNALDARSILQSPGLDILRQNQFGATLGGPIEKDRTFIFLNYEGQRRGESPFYNSVILSNIAAINNVKVNVFGLPPEPPNLDVLRTFDTDQGFVRLDHNFGQRHYLFARYFIVDGRLTNQSPLNDGFDLPSAFKNNFFRDSSLVGNFNSTFTPTLLNEVRAQFSRRFFDFPTVTTQPHLEVANTFAVGVNRGNPDFYLESRFEILDNITLIRNKHTLSFGGNFNFVRTTESFPLFFPFEATFASLDAFFGTGPFAMLAGGPSPFVIFFQRNVGPNFNEPTLNPAVYQGGRIDDSIRNLARGTLDHTYNGFYIQDKWRATDRLTLNFGLRWDFETWPQEAIDDELNNFDPRFGFAYNFGTRRNVVLRGGFGVFHGIIPSNLLACQIPSCGGTIGEFPGRQAKENDLNARTRLWAFASNPFSPLMNLALTQLLAGNYTDAVPLMGCPGNPLLNPPLPAGRLAGCGFFGDSVIVRFAQDHQAPYALQSSLSLEVDPFPDTTLSLTYLRVKGVHLSSFFNINQPAPSTSMAAPLTFHTSSGTAGLKDLYFVVLDPTQPVGAFPNNIFPGTAQPTIAVYFEADSRWNSVYDGFLLSLNKRPSHNFAFGLSYTWAKSIDDGPNPSFVLIPQDSANIDRERALSSDDVRHRFVGNATITGPTKVHPIVNDFSFGMILTLQSAQHFPKFAGFDSNGDVFGVNDRVGIEPRNTFEGDSLKSFDVRVARSFRITERVKADFIWEAFNLFNTLNIRFFNTVYGAADFCPFNPTATGCAVPPAPSFLEGSPNPNYGTPRAVFNPRQMQFALRISF